MKDFLSSWFNVSMGGQGRDNLDKSDKVWNDAYKFIIDNNDTELIFSGDLLFRVHTKWKNEPKYKDYNDYGEYQDEVFQNEHSFWEKQNDIDAIIFDNHWVSFTDSVDVIDSDYFSGKGLKGFVIVIKPKKAINIYPFRRIGFDEREVVAPMDKSTVVEVLPFDEFIKKYKK